MRPHDAHRLAVERLVVQRLQGALRCTIRKQTVFESGLRRLHDASSPAAVPWATVMACLLANLWRASEAQTALGKGTTEGHVPTLGLRVSNVTCVSRR